MLAFIKDRLNRMITEALRREELSKTAAAELTPPHPVDAVVLDPLTYHQVESARALAAGLATTYTVDIQGDVAEFGTMTGFTARSLARSISICESQLPHAMAVYKTKPKNLYLFDSFCGLPEMTDVADSASPHVQAGAWTPGSCRGLTPDELTALVTQELPPQRVTVVPGWFKDTIATLPAETRFCVVHVDGDLYSSAIDVLSNLFARGLVASGCIIFFDDWNCNRASPEFGERKAWAEITRQFDVRFSDRGGYGLFGHSFFVHSYRGQ